MVDSEDIIAGIITALNQSGEFISLWQRQPQGNHCTLVFASPALTRYRQCHTATKTMEQSVLGCIQEHGSGGFKQKKEQLEKNCGELYIQSLQPVDSEHYLLKHDRVPYPFELHHRSRSKAVSDIERLIIRNIVHELLTPINSIQGINEQLANVGGDDDHRELLLHLSDASHDIKKHLSEIVNFISLSNKETQTYQKDNFDIFETLFSVSSKANRSILIQQRQLNFNLTYPLEQESLPLLGHADLLEQLLLHLIDNAIKFTPDGGDIFVKATLTDQATLHFSVTDSGCGIAVADHAILFRPFVLGNLNETHTTKGLGLGLASALECLIIITGNCDVELQLDSSPGKGSCFSFDIPYLKSTSEVTSKAQDLKLPHAVDHYQILVAEDNPTQQMIIRKLIKHLGFHAKLVGNGLEVVGEFIREDNHYDLILMDIQMPGISGLEATKLIRKHEQQFNLGRIPIIAITANIEQEVHSESIACGMDGHYGKPVSRIVLDKLIRQALLRMAKGRTITR